VSGDPAGVSFPERKTTLQHFRFIAGLLLLGLTAGCKAQTPPPAPSSALDRRIEVMVRSQYELPPDVNLSLGARKPSQFPGYETLPITISHNGKSQVIEFLISPDNTKLVHLDTLDLTKQIGRAHV
jgi:hypothetical protein